MRLETALLCRAHLTLGHWHERASTMLAEVWLRRMIADGDSSNIVKAQQLSANAGRVLDSRHGNRRAAGMDQHEGWPASVPIAYQGGKTQITSCSLRL